MREFQLKPMMRRAAIFGLTMFVTLTCTGKAASTPGDGTRDIVVVLHGMGRTKLSMVPLSNHLRHLGYEVFNLSYPSTKQSIADSAGQLHKAMEQRGLSDSRRVHFVTHSLGGIVVRAYLKQHRPGNLGRVVMISPPNQGSEVADRLRNNCVYKWATGPAGQELGTDDSSTPMILGSVDFPLGIISGDRSFNPLFSAWIEGRSDGKVSVQRTSVQGMTDLLVVPHSHSFIMRSSLVMGQVARFLENGVFDHSMP